MTDRQSRVELRKRRIDVLLLYAANVFITMCQGALEVVYPPNLERLGYPYQVIGATISLLWLGALLSQLPGGAWYSFRAAACSTSWR